MVSFEVTGFEELLTKLNKLERIDEVAPRMLEDGIEVLQKEVVAEALKHKDTGEMAESIKPTGVFANADGSYYICTRPTGYASGKKWKNARKGKGEGKGQRRVRNMEKLIWLELGVKGRLATPVITKAVIRASPAVIEAMSKRFYREVGIG